MKNQIKTETTAPYHKAPAAMSEDEIIARALSILLDRLEKRRVPDVDAFISPDAVRAYLLLKVAALQSEVFGLLFLDNQHRLIADEVLFHGTIDAASVYPREVLSRVISHNAAAVVLYHNHPSGFSEPSEADKNITKQIKDVLKMIDVQTLDHFIVGETVYSFAEHGLL